MQQLAPLPLRVWVRLVLGIALLAVATPVALLLASAGFRAAGTRLWCSLAAAAAGLRLERSGPEPPEGCLVASNHLGYLDTLVLGALSPGSFLAKDEMAAWPLMGTLTRQSGAVFVGRRAQTDAPFVDELRRTLEAGRRVLLFPEAGVSGDGVTLGRFRPMFFEASITSGRPVVPVAIRYMEPPDPKVWAWVDETSLWKHLRSCVLPAGRICVEARFGEALWPRPGEGRKELAARTRLEVERLLR